MMNGAVVGKIELALGQRLSGPSVGNFGLEIVEFALITQVQPVN
jgi:hypothetical protein